MNNLTGQGNDARLKKRMIWNDLESAFYNLVITHLYGNLRETDV